MPLLVRRERRRPKAEINVVPYIDVMLVLLVIFMITAPLITAGIHVELPHAEAEPLPPSEEKPIIVTVNANGLYYFNEDTNSYSLEETIELVATLLNQKPGLRVFVNGDKNADYGQVVELLGRLNVTVGVENVGLMTNPVE